jgi:hypothetical protein
VCASATIVSGFIHTLTHSVHRQWLYTHSLCSLLGQALPRAISHQWGERVLDEFQLQVAKETAAGLPVAPFMTGLEDPVKRTKTQVRVHPAVTCPRTNMGICASYDLRVLGGHIL